MESKHIFSKIIAASVATTLICSCSNKGRQITQLQNQSEIAVNEASILISQADEADSEDTAMLLLKSAESYLSANHVDNASNILFSALPPNLTEEEDSYRNILLARISLVQDKPYQASKHLDNVWTPTSLDDELKRKYYLTRSEVYKRQGNFYQAASERVYAASLIPEGIDQELNDKAIWQILTQLTPSSLRTLQGNEKNTLNGWLAFTNINKQYDSSPQQLMRAYLIWQKKYPDHPANKLVAIKAPSKNESKILKNKAQNLDPNKIAVLLPLTGSYSATAKAVRDGFLAAHFNDSTKTKPKINFYDTTAYSSIEEAYKIAQNDGNGLVVGPLIKEDVENIAKANLKTPVLALNTSATTNHNLSLYQFGLPPESEAKLVAKKAWDDGHRRALIITSTNKWGQRVQESFVEEFTKLGGKILSSTEVSDKKNLSANIKSVLAVNKSNQRIAELKRIGIKVNAEPRRRQDADMVYIATNASMARQIKPLLNFYYAKSLPVYASSSIYNGKSNPNLDKDLDGVIFCDMPWILDKAITSRKTYKSVSSLWPQKFEQYPRLYALGLDAYKVIVSLDQLSNLTDTGLSGMTGMLTINDNMQVQRNLMWAKFVKGKPKLIGSKG